jgi:hypothetical protein
MDGFKSLPKMQHFKEGGQVKTAYCGGGRMQKKEGGKIEDKDMAQDKAMIKKAFKQHDKAEHDKEPTEIKLKKGGRSKKEAGTVRKFKVGGSVSNVYEAKKSSGDIDNIKKTKDIKPGKAKAKSGAKGGPNKYAEGGDVTEGENANIDNDTRARAMKWMQEQADKGDSEESKPKAAPKAKVKKVTADDEAGKSRGRPAEGEPKMTKSRSEAREPSGNPTPGNGNSVEGTDFSRNVKNTMNALAPIGGGIGKIGAELAFAGRTAKAAEAAKSAKAAAEATRASRVAKLAPRAEREAKTLNPNAWTAGPKGMKENFKSGRSVKRFAEGKLVVSDPKAVSDKASRELEEAMNPISMAKEVYGKAKSYIKDKTK